MFKITDLRPASEPGWRVVVAHVTEPGASPEFDTRPLVGWATMAEYDLYDPEYAETKDDRWIPAYVSYANGRAEVVTEETDDSGGAVSVAVLGPAEELAEDLRALIAYEADSAARASEQRAKRLFERVNIAKGGAT